MKLVLVAAVCLAVLSAATSAQEAKPALHDLSALAGCWEMNDTERQLVVTEQWMKPGGGTMIGSGRTVRAGKTVDYEFVRIVEEVDGIFYIAKPVANKDETRFRLVKGSINEFVFENPTHDYPQRIVYRRNGDKLNARIEGTSNGKARAVDFPYTRAKCE